MSFTSTAGFSRGEAPQNPDLLDQDEASWSVEATRFLGRGDIAIGTAGEQITADMLRTTDVDADSTVNLVPGDGLDGLIGRYAKVRLVSGSLITANALQDGPLVRPGSAVVAIQVAEGTLPIGLRERVPVLLVVGSSTAEGTPTTVTGRVVGLPVATTSALGVESLSIEVDLTDAPRIAAADDVRVVLVEPIEDPATAAPTSSEDLEP